jgi:hypothetical protein
LPSLYFLLPKGLEKFNPSCRWQLGHRRLDGDGSLQLCEAKLDASLSAYICEANKHASSYASSAPAQQETFYMRPLVSDPWAIRLHFCPMGQK